MPPTFSHDNPGGERCDARSARIEERGDSLRVVRQVSGATWVLLKPEDIQPYRVCTPAYVPDQNPGLSGV